MDKKRIEKEIKKAQKKGIYNPKLKLGIVGLILVIGTVIGVSYAYYTETASNALIINATISKKIMVRVEAGEHGQVESMSIATKQADYGTAAKFTVTPSSGYKYKGVSCDNSANTSHSGTTLTVTPRTSKDVTCTVDFEEIPYLRTKILGNTIKSTLPDFSKGFPNKNTSSEDIQNNSGLYKMKDDSGQDSYYFRGEVDNYVKFGKGKTSDNSTQHDLLWRIVRINGDGSIRLILDSDIGKSNFNIEYTQRKYAGYTYDNEKPCTSSSPCQSIEIATNNEENIGTTDHGGTNSTIKKKLEAWYYENLRDYDSYITYGIFCNDTSYGSESETGTLLYYGAYQRLRGSNPVKPQLTCPDPTVNGYVSSDYITELNNTRYHTYGGVYKLKIGLLSADEMILGGISSILIEGNSVGDDDALISNYLYDDSFLMTMSPYYAASNSYSFANYIGYKKGHLSYTDVYDKEIAKPVINLKQDVIWSGGNGTKSNPYIVS